MKSSDHMKYKQNKFKGEKDKEMNSSDDKI